MSREQHSDISIVACTRREAQMAASLLVRFFREEGFAGEDAAISRNLNAMLDHPDCWAALAVQDARFIGIATVTAMRDIEYGKLAEIGDLYVVPEARQHGVAQKLIKASVDWCRQAGCKAILVTITPDGDRAHNLIQFYKRRRFEMTDRMIAARDLSSGI